MAVMVPTLAAQSTGCRRLPSCAFQNWRGTSHVRAGRFSLNLLVVVLVVVAAWVNGQGNALPVVDRDDALPSWKGESHTVSSGASSHSSRSASASATAAGQAEEEDGQGEGERGRSSGGQPQVPASGFDPTRVIRISWSPRAFLYRDFLSDSEVDHLLSFGRSEPRGANGTRRNVGTFLVNKDDIIRRIEQRVSDWVFIPVEHGQAIQMMYYALGQHHHPHMDWLDQKPDAQRGGIRVATIIMYLNTVELGGETVFLNSKREIKDLPFYGETKCGSLGVSVKPRKGDALLFYIIHPNNTLDEHSLHTSCPVLRGEKWSATKWLHVRRWYTPEHELPCVNRHASCVAWAKNGECKSNPSFMVGNEQHVGNCRLACEVCKPAKEESEKQYD